MTGRDPELNPVNQFLVEQISIDGVEAQQRDDGTLAVSVPALEQDATLFHFDRGGLKRFYRLWQEAGSLALDVKMEGVGKGVRFNVFGVTELWLPEDADEYSFAAHLGQTAIKSINTGEPQSTQVATIAIH